MNSLESKLHRLSYNQLKALSAIAKAPNCTLSSNAASVVVGLTGKSLGGVYSSLSRQSFRKQPLILPWGRSRSGRGLRWKLNEDVISGNDLLEVVNRLL